VSALMDLSNNKIGESAREHPIFLWILVFFYGHLLWFHFSLVLSISKSSGYPDRPSGSRGLFKFCFIFQKFD
jgi:hypothetical protein